MDYTLIGGKWLAPLKGKGEMAALLEEWDQLLAEMPELARLELEPDRTPEVAARRRRAVATLRRLHQGFAHYSVPVWSGRHAGLADGTVFEVLGIAANAPLGTAKTQRFDKGQYKQTRLILTADKRGCGREYPTYAEYHAALQIAAFFVGGAPFAVFSQETEKDAARIYKAAQLLETLEEVGMKSRPHRLEYALIRFLPAEFIWPLEPENKFLCDETFGYEEFHTWDLQFPCGTPRSIVKAASENSVGLNALFSAIRLHTPLSALN